MKTSATSQNELFLLNIHYSWTWRTKTVFTSEFIIRCASCQERLFLL